VRIPNSPSEPDDFPMNFTFLMLADAANSYLVYRGNMGLAIFQQMFQKMK
jgi:hypothetical protein